MRLPAVSFGVSVFAVVAVWREVTYRGFLPLPAAVLPLLCLTGLGLSARSWSRSAEFGGKAIAALGVVLSLGALVVVLLLLVVALLYVGSSPPYERTAGSDSMPARRMIALGAQTVGAATLVTTPTVGDLDQRRALLPLYSQSIWPVALPFPVPLTAEVVSANVQRRVGHRVRHQVERVLVEVGDVVARGVVAGVVGLARGPAVDRRLLPPT